MAKENFENSMQELESIVAKLEEGNIELDNALELFEKGIGISKKLREALVKAEQKVTKLTAEEDAGEVLFDTPTE